MEAFEKIAEDQGLLLDDFVENSFRRRSAGHSRHDSWIGIFHHPVKVDSPLRSDSSSELLCIGEHRHWPASRYGLRGAIALCDEVANELRAWLNLPVLKILHPTETDVPLWNAEIALLHRNIVQVGFFLRNTQLIFQIAPAGWRRVQLNGVKKRCFGRRDAAIRDLQLRPVINQPEVTVLKRTDNASYDRMLSESVVVCELYGAAANNLIVECMIRGTPILVNRLPAVEEYLGNDYSLFYNDVTEIPQMLNPELLMLANSQLLARSKLLPTFHGFANQVHLFVESCRA